MTFELVRLTLAADATRLQRLLDQCSDYYEMHERWGTPPDAAVYEMTAPGDRVQDDLLVLALEDGAGTLQAMIQMLKDHPERGMWWIGLMLVAPEQRSRGLGAQLVRHAISAASAAGAGALRLAVSVQNPRAESFWSRAGFRSEGPGKVAPARSGHVDTVRIMSQSL